MPNKPALLLSLMLACTAAGAEPLNYNIVEFDESVSATVPRDTMTASFVIRAEGRDRSAVNRAFTAKLRSFSRRAEGKTFETAQFGRTALHRFQERAADLGKTLGFSGYKIVRLRIYESGSPSAVMAKSFAEGRYAAVPEALSASPATAPDLPVSPGNEEIRVTVNGTVQM